MLQDFTWEYRKKCLCTVDREGTRKPNKELCPSPVGKHMDLLWVSCKSIVNSQVITMLGNSLINLRQSHHEKKPLYCQKPLFPTNIPIFSSDNWTFSEGRFSWYSSESLMMSSDPSSLLYRGLLMTLCLLKVSYEWSQLFCLKRAIALSIPEDIYTKDLRHLI